MKKEKKVLTENQIERRKAITDTLKSMIFPLVVCLIILAGVFAIVTYENAEKPEEVIPPYAFDGSTDPVVMENDALKFTMDPETTQFELLVKSSGKVWKSNPDNASNDPIALPEEKAKLQSTLVMSYNTENGLETTYNSYGFSVSNGIYEIETGDDYVTVHYSLGS